MSVDLPSELLAAIASDVGSQVTLVIGAGCSLEPPTSLPLSKDLSRRAYAALVADRVIAADACSDPEDLSSVAEAVLEATGSQRALVRALPRSQLRSAEPNRGYHYAAALLREGAIGDLVTLNFDLAQSSAVADLGGSDVAIIDGPEFHADLGRANVVYLHRNANCPDPDTWILTRKAMRDAWEDVAWEAIIVRRSAAAPVVLFAGLGSPADVLEHSIREIRRVVHNEVFLAEPGDPEASSFFTALDIELDHVIPARWVDLMAALADRVAAHQRQTMLGACQAREVQEGWGIEGWDAVRSFLAELDLLDLGRLRAGWTLRQGRYSPTTEDIAEQLAELLAVVELLIKATSFRPQIQSSGAVAFWDSDNRLRGVLAFVSGRGARSAFAIEIDIEKHRKYAPGGGAPSTYIIAGVSGSSTEASAPENIATGEAEDELIGGWGEWSTVLAHDICQTGQVVELIT